VRSPPQGSWSWCNRGAPQACVAACTHRWMHVLVAACTHHCEGRRGGGPPAGSRSEDHRRRSNAERSSKPPLWRSWGRRREGARSRHLREARSRDRGYARGWRCAATLDSARPVGQHLGSCQCLIRERGRERTRRSSWIEVGEDVAVAPTAEEARSIRPWGRNRRNLTDTDRYQPDVAKWIEGPL
jgi:hypothetical protein